MPRVSRPRDSTCLDIKHFAILSEIVSVGYNFYQLYLKLMSHLPVIQGALPVRVDVLPTVRTPWSIFFGGKDTFHIIQLNIILLWVLLILIMILILILYDEYHLCSLRTNLGSLWLVTPLPLVNFTRVSSLP